MNKKILIGGIVPITSLFILAACNETETESESKKETVTKIDTNVVLNDNYVNLYKVDLEEHTKRLLKEDDSFRVDTYLMGLTLLMNVYPEFSTIKEINDYYTEDMLYTSYYMAGTQYLANYVYYLEYMKEKGYDEKELDILISIFEKTNNINNLFLNYLIVQDNKKYTDIDAMTYKENPSIKLKTIDEEFLSIYQSNYNDLVEIIKENHDVLENYYLINSISNENKLITKDNVQEYIEFISYISKEQLNEDYISDFLNEISSYNDVKTNLINVDILIERLESDIKSDMYKNNQLFKEYIDSLEINKIKEIKSLLEENKNEEIDEVINSINVKHMDNIIMNKTVIDYGSYIKEDKIKENFY